MEIEHVLVGLATGLPVMIVVGPIALLLVQEGMERGLRGGGPAVAGVASVDLLFSAVASFAGAGAVRALEPVAGWLELLATGVLGVLAVGIWRSARADLRGDERGAVSEPAFATDLVSSDLMFESAGPEELRMQEVPAAAMALSPRLLAGWSIPASARRASRFFAATALNPMTIVVFTSLVVSGRDGVGTPGWVIGMTIASVLVGVTFVTVGHGLGAVLDEVATARLRMGGAVLVAAMALWFALG